VSAHAQAHLSQGGQSVPLVVCETLRLLIGWSSLAVAVAVLVQ